MLTLQEKSEPLTKQLNKLKSRLGAKKNTPEGKSILRNSDKLILSRGLLYYKYQPKYHINVIKQFVVPKAYRRTIIDSCHQDTGNQGKKRTESLISDWFWWPRVHDNVNTAGVSSMGERRIELQSSP